MITKVVIHRGEITFHVAREHLPALVRHLRDDAHLRFEFCSSVSGVHYPADKGRELHAVYHLQSMTHNRRIRLEVSVPDADPHIPSVVPTYPTADWHERETYDMFGIVFDGHPALTRILMPDDWPGHPQRKDYPLGGIPVEYKGATIPPPDQRRSYTDDHDHRSSRHRRPVRGRGADAAEGHVYTVTGQDWDSIVSEQAERGDERIVVNMGPQHPSTHGVLRLILEMEGESVHEARCGIGYLHTGIEKNMEFRTWTQGVTFCTRMDYLAPLYNETTYCLGVERLLDIEDADPGEGQRHPGDDDGAQPDLLAPGLHRHRRHGDRRADRDDHRLPRAGEGAGRVRADHRPADEPCLHPARRGGAGPARRRARPCPRPGGLDAQAPARVRGVLQREPDLQGPARRRRLSRPGRLPGPGDHRAAAALTGYDWDLRKKQPYCGYETYDFEVPDLGHRRRVRPVPDPAERDVGEPQDRRAVRRAAGEDEGPAGDGRRQEDRLAGAAVHRLATGWATPTSTSSTSWASRWRR